MDRGALAERFTCPGCARVVAGQRSGTTVALHRHNVSRHRGADRCTVVTFEAPR